VFGILPKTERRYGNVPQAAQQNTLECLCYHLAYRNANAHKTATIAATAVANAAIHPDFK
jgi:hypothetical protein